MIELAVTSLLVTGTKTSIFSAKTHNDKLMRVVAENLWCDPCVGETYNVEGKIDIYQDPYGRQVPQIKATSLERTQTSGKLILPWLSSLQGIGKTRSQRLWDAFGSGIITILEDPNSLDQVAEVIEPKRSKLGIELAMRLNRAINEKSNNDRFGLSEGKFRLRLEKLGITDKRAVKRIWRMIGSDSAEKAFLKNPFMTATLIPWKSADSIGQIIIRSRDKTDPSDCPERLIAAMDSSWRHFLQNGHTAASEKQMKNLLTKRLGSYSRVVKALNLGKRYGAAISCSNGLLRAPGAAFMENEIADRINTMTSKPTDNFDEIKIHNIVHDVENNMGIHLFDEQRDAVIRILKRDFSILQGGAGSGKTFIMKILVKTWETLGGEVQLACLAGKASMQLRKSTDMPAYTLAGLLRYLRGREQLNIEGKTIPANWPNLTPTTLLIVDEASMVDVGIWHELLDFMPSGCRLVMVGDNGQLPPVGIGQIYHDLVKSYPNVVRLSMNHRQKSKSGIPGAASMIRQGRMPIFQTYSGANQGVQFVKCSQNHVLQNVSRIKDEILTQVDSGDVLVCAALRNTVDAINESGAERNHKDKESIRVAPGVWITSGDPVVYTENRYKEELFNGLLGRVVQVSNGAEINAMIHWDGEDEPREIHGKEMAGIELAYAITTHKVQGSSAPRIIVPLEHSRLVTRQWLYTAITRAEEQCVFVGERSVLLMGLKRQTERITGFQLGGYHEGGISTGN